MQIVVYIMQSDFTIQLTHLSIQEDTTVAEIYKILVKQGSLKADVTYGMSIFGDRVTMKKTLCAQDRLEFSLPLPSDPMERRRRLALKRKNK